MKKRFLPTVEKFVSSYRPLIIILFLTFLVRLPSLFEPLWVDDEAIYLTAGQKILRGGLMYVDIFDHKTPGIYYLAAVAIKILGASIWSFRFLLMVWVLVTVATLYLLAKKMFNPRLAVWASIFFAALTSTPLLEGNTANSEILMVLPVILAIFVGLDKKYFFAGVFFSLAFLLKFPAIFDFAAFLIFVGLLATRRQLRQALENFLQLVAGFLLPFCLTIIFFAIKGSLGAYFEAAFLFNISYLQYNNHFIIEHGLLIVKAIPLLLIFIYFLAKFFFQTKSKKGTLVSHFEFLLLWFAFSFYGAAFAGRPYEHYLIQAVPPFSLIAAAVLSQKKLRRVGVGLLVAVVVLTFILRFRPAIPASYYPNFFRYASGCITFDTYADSLKPGTSRSYALASFLNGCKKFTKDNCEESRTKQGDKLYVYANAPAIYFLSGLDPATRYINFYHVNENKAIQEKVAKEISNNTPSYILVEKGQEVSFPDLEKILHSRYNRLDHISPVVSLPRYNLFAFYEEMAIYQLIPATTR